MPLIKIRPFDPGSSGILAGGKFLNIRAILWSSSLFVIGLGAMFASVFGARWLHLRGNVYLLPAILVPLMTCCLYVLLVRRFEARKAWELRIDGSLVPEVALGFVYGGAFITSMWGLLYACGMYSVHRGVWTHWVDDFIFDSYVSAIIEEVVFRAALLRIFARLWGVRNGVLLSSLIFGLVHITHGSWLGVVGIAINGGITMALLYVMTGRIWLSAGMHLGYDFIETSVLGVNSDHGFLVSTPNQHAAAWLSVGSFGPDAAVPAMVLGLLINVVLLRFVFGPRSKLDGLKQRPSFTASQAL